mmetsp:Transcript_19698/g.78434  ORF Transcript_19698/g.78434 Transcript_19698/m.78434 type:complete len:399 (-) Transcript_19698:12-1208(-)
MCCGANDVAVTSMSTPRLMNNRAPRRGALVLVALAVVRRGEGLVVAPPPLPTATARSAVVAERLTTATLPGLRPEDEVIELPTLDPDLGGPSSDAKPPSEFELNLGRCLDALRADVPEFFDRELQWDVYDKDIEIRDPSGVQLQGLAMYKQTFALVRLFRRVMIDDVSVTFRLRYDWVRRRIVVQWYSAWTSSIAKNTAGHVDAVSIFHLNDRGLIYRHEIDKIMINDKEVQPPYGLGWLSFRAHVLSGLDRRAIPAGACPGGAFCSEATDTADAPAQPSSEAASASRMMIASSEPSSEQRAASLSGALSSSSSKQPQSRRRRDDAEEDKGVLDRLPQTCENVWDCESPLFCCDFAFIKVCCSQGSPAWAPQPIPIPVPADRFPRGPGGPRSPPFPPY